LFLASTPPRNEQARRFHALHSILPILHQDTAGLKGYYPGIVAVLAARTIRHQSVNNQLQQRRIAQLEKELAAEKAKKK
jgi:hypothetical protein